MGPIRAEAVSDHLATLVKGINIFGVGPVEGLCTKKESWALIERPYSRKPQAVRAVYDRPGFFVQSWGGLLGGARSTTVLNSHGSDAQISCRVNSAPFHASLSVTASSNRRGSVNPREGAVFTELRRLWAPYFGGPFHSPDRNETGCDHPRGVSVLVTS